MNTEIDFDTLFAGVENTQAYAAEAALLEFTEEMVRLMEQQEVSQAELARRMDCTPAYISKILRGSTNFTLSSMARIAHALDSTLRIRMSPVGYKARKTGPNYGLKAKNHRQPLVGGVAEGK